MMSKILRISHLIEGAVGKTLKKTRTGISAHDDSDSKPANDVIPAEHDQSTIDSTGGESGTDNPLYENIIVHYKKLGWFI